MQVALGNMPNHFLTQSDDCVEIAICRNIMQPFIVVILSGVAFNDDIVTNQN